MADFRNLLTRSMRDGRLDDDEVSALATKAGEGIATSNKPTALTDVFEATVKAARPKQADQAALDAFDQQLDSFEFQVTRLRDKRRGDLVVGQLGDYFRQTKPAALPRELREVDPSSLAVVDESSDSWYVGFHYKMKDAHGERVRGIEGDAASLKMKTLVTGTLKTEQIGYFAE